MKVLNQESCEQFLNNLNSWTFVKDGIEKKIKFKNFPEAISFIVQLGFIAEKLKHHPEISNVYNNVELRLTTHDAGGVTEKDFQLAEEIDKLLLL